MTKPVIVAQFILDEIGMPKEANDGYHTHYYIKLMVKDTPEDAYAVTYELHESYYDPIRESLRLDDNFEERITSYGDYQVKAIVRSKTRNQTLVAVLSQALALGHENEISPAIAAALENIRKN